MLKDKTNFLEFKNNKWVIQDRFTNLKKYANDYFKDELEKFKKDVIQILSERNPKFDLSSDKRSMANIYNKTLTYSNLLRKLIMNNIGIGYINKKSVQQEIDSGIMVELKNFKNLPIDNISIIYNSKKNNKIVASFIEILKNTIRNINN